MKVSQLEMAHVVRASLQVPGMPVLTSNQCYLLAQELNKNLAPAQQGQGEPVVLPERRPEFGSDIKWNAYHDEIAKLGPLYPRADPAEVERLRDQLKSLGIELKAVTAEHDESLSKLAEAQALLREWLEISKRHQQPVTLGTRTEAHLSASAEPSAPVEIEERAEFQREDRYIVIKRSDLAKVPAAYRSALVEPLLHIQAHLPRRECLVIESDWPEYETTWAAIEARAALERKS